MAAMDKVAKVYIAIIIIVIYAPILLMMLLSFNTSARPSFPMEGFTLHWFIGEIKGYEYSSYIPVIHYWQFWNALQSSIQVSVVVGMLSCILVTATALSLRHRVVGRDIVFYLILLGFITPGVALGIGNVLMYKMFDIGTSFWSIVFIDVIFAVPFGLVLMMARFDPDLMLYENAASVLKASPVKTFRRVTLPLIQWEVLSAGILGFLLSWGELIRSMWVVRGSGVLSTFIFNQLSVNPTTTRWFAAGTIVAVISFVSLLVLGYLLTRGVKT